MKTQCRILTIGYGRSVLESVFFRVAQEHKCDFQYLLHPRYVPESLPDLLRRPDVHCVRNNFREPMPAADRPYLASLERADVPTIHNMLFGDRVVSKLSADEGLCYLTFLGRRFTEHIERIAPDVIVTGSDSVHSSMAFAVARNLGIPIFNMFFGVIPEGMVAFGTGLLPSSRIAIRARPTAQLRALAEDALEQFEQRGQRVYAYVPPKPRGPLQHLKELPRRLAAIGATIARGRQSEYLKFTEKKTSLGVGNALLYLRERHLNRKALRQIDMITDVPTGKFVLFGFHYQPESSIDVWAPFFSDQLWVVNLLSRCVPPDVTILAKVHKSDISGRSRAQLEYLNTLPGVRIVAPQVDSRDLVNNAQLVVGIQGTIGLEAALLGKPVIMLGSSPVCQFPSVTEVGTLRGLPELVRAKLREKPPQRDAIIDSYMKFLSPFFDASHNAWTRPVADSQIEGYRVAFHALRDYVRQSDDAATVVAHDGGG